MKRWRGGDGVVGVAGDGTRRAGVCVDVEVQASIVVVVWLNISTRTLPFPPACRLRLATPASSEPAAAASTGQTRREVCAGTVYGT